MARPCRRSPGSAPRRALGALAQDVSHDGDRSLCHEHRGRSPTRGRRHRPSPGRPVRGGESHCAVVIRPPTRRWRGRGCRSGPPVSPESPRRGRCAFAASSRRSSGAAWCAPSGAAGIPGVLDKLGQQVQDHKLDLLDVLRIGGRDHQREIGQGRASPPSPPSSAMERAPRCFAARKAATTFFERPLVLIATRTSPGWPSASTWRANTSS